MFCAALAALSLRCAAAKAAGAAALAPTEVKTSTGGPSVFTIYTAQTLRDPFVKGGFSGSSGGAISAKTYSAQDFNIHNLSMRGVMKDAGSDYALFSDNNFGVSFILRKAKLYDSRGKIVAGITGSLNIRKKTVNLSTRDGDVQTFRLGEENKE